MIEWTPDDRRASGHIKADTSKGEYLAGPRKSDGCWEYMTPTCECFGDHNQHIFYCLTEAQAKTACETHLKEGE